MATNGFDKKSKFIVRPNEIYEITINPDDSLQGTGDLRDIKLNTYMIDMLGKSCKYLMRLELKMPQYGRFNKNNLPRLHYHGFIYWESYDDIYQFYLVKWQQLTAHSSVQLNYNNDRREYWTNYMKKQAKWIPKKGAIIHNIKMDDFKSLPSAGPEEDYLE